MGITPGWAGEIWLADLGIRLPAQKGTRLNAPENFRAEGPVSNAVVAVNYVAGLQWPVLQIPLAVTSNWFYRDLLNAMLGVPNRPEPILAGYGGWYGVPRAIVTADLDDLGPIWVYNGATAWQLEACKCCLFTIGNAQGEYVRAGLTFWGTSIHGIGWTRSLTPFTERAARSQNCGHNLPRNPTRWSLSVRNPLKPNAVFSSIPPPGNERFMAPREHNTGTLEVGASLMLNAHDQWGGIADGTPFYFRVVPPGGDSVGLNITNPLWSDRYNVEFSEGQRQRAPLTCKGRGNPSGASPLIIL